MRWYVGPWQERNVPMPSRNPPEGFGGLDLSTTTTNVGIFYGTGALDNGYRLLANGSWDDTPNAVQRSAIPARAGYSHPTTTLRGILASLLSDGSDPDGVEAPRPLVPTSELRLELHAGYRASMKFTWGRAHTGVLRTLLRRRFAEQLLDLDAGRLSTIKLRRIVGGLCRKYRLDASDWREFVPVSLQPHFEGPLDPETTITETFTGSDGAALGPNLTWTSISGTWSIKSNAATKSATNSVVDLARADSDLSSSDHYAQVVRKDTFTNFFPGPCARVPSTSTKTCYLMFVGGGFQYITKLVSGTQTNITNSACSNVNGDVYKIHCNGSTIKAYKNDVEQLSVTDTSITTGVRCGITAYAANSTVPILDTFEAADLVSATPIPVFMNQYRQRR